MSQHRPLSLDDCIKMLMGFYSSCKDGQFAECCLNAAAALRTCQEVTPKALELFQSGGKFAEALQCGDHVVIKGFAAMARFCERHAAQFMAEECS